MEESDGNINNNESENIKTEDELDDEEEENNIKKEESNQFLYRIESISRSITHNAVTSKLNTMLAFREKQRSDALLMVERVRRQRRRDCLMIGIDNKWLQVWDGLILLLLFQLALFLPFQLGVSGSYFQLHNVAFFAWNTLCNGIFFIDTFLPFFRMYYDHRGFLVMNSHRVAVHYMKSTFLPNLLSIFPGSLLYYILYQARTENSPGNARYVLFLKLTDLLKFVRLNRFPIIIKRSELIRNLRKRARGEYLQIFGFLVSVIIVTHWLACMWCFVATIECDFEYGRASMLNHSNWIGNWYLLNYGNGSSEGGLDPLGDENYLARYALALFWSIQTLTSIGYGNIVPYTSAEFWIGSVLQLLSGVAWAYVIGSAVSIASAMQANSEAFRAELDSANALIRSFRDDKKTLKHREKRSEDHIGKSFVLAESREDVEKKIRQFIYTKNERGNNRNKLTVKTRVDESHEVLHHLPSDLRRLSCYFLVKGSFDLIPYFSVDLVPLEVLGMAAEMCSHMQYAGGTSITMSVNDPVEERGMYVMILGCGMIAGEGRSFRVLNKGSVFNELQYLMYNQASYNSDVNVAFFNYSEVLFIPNEVLDMVLRLCPKVWSRIGRYRYLRKLITCKMRRQDNTESV